MSNACTIRKHLWGVCDPLLLFDVYQLVAYFGGFLLISALIARQAGIEPTQLWVLFLPFLFVPFGRVWGWVRDRRANVVGEIPQLGLPSGGLSVIGRKCEIEAIMRAGGSAGISVSRFRCGFSVEQQCILFVTVLLLLPFLRMFTESSPSVLAAVCASIYAAMLLLLFLNRRRYVVSSGVLVVEHLGGQRVVHTDSISLEGARIRVDFAEGNLDIAAQEGMISIHLRELFNPHQFVRTLVSASR